LMPFKTMIQGGVVDVAVLDPAERLLLRLLQFETGSGANFDSIREPFRILTSLMLCPLAYSLWGILGLESPLQALLVYPDAMYLVSLSRPADVAEWPLGLVMDVDVATRPMAMEAMMSGYLQPWKALSEMATQTRPDRPLRQWIPINVDLQEGVAAQDRLAAVPSMGFLMRCAASVLKGKLAPLSGVAQWDLSVSDEREAVLVKYLSALLDVDYERRAARVLMVWQRSDRFPRVKHPYVLVASQGTHYLLVMRDAGMDLCQLLAADDGFPARWLAARGLRWAFFEDVGLSALNLTGPPLFLSHNDIRLPNVGFRDGRFCLLDFDIAAAEAPRCLLFGDACFHTEVANGLFSLAQIALVVFQVELHHRGEPWQARSAAEEMRSLWLSQARDGLANSESDGLRMFSEWATSRGVGDVFCTDPARRLWGWAQLEDKLRRILSLGDEAGPEVGGERQL